MTAVLLALASAASFGAMTVAIRVGLASGGSASRASAATLVTSLVVTFAASLVRHDYTVAWQFFLAGLLAPGLSQILFTRAMKDVGASRTSVTRRDGAALRAGDRVHVPRRAGRGAARRRCGRDRRGRDAARRRSATGRGTCSRSGSCVALGAAVLFAVRDNIVRALHAHGSPETVAAATMLAGLLVGLVVGPAAADAARGCARSRPAGLLFGLSYICLFEAYFRGRVSVVSPLVATESLWGVGLAALVLGRSEAVGWRVVAGAARDRRREHR